MSGIDAIANVSSETYIMFHEMVVAPLTVLNDVCESLTDFVRGVWSNCINFVENSGGGRKNQADIQAKVKKYFGETAFVTDILLTVAADHIGLADCAPDVDVPGGAAAADNRIGKLNNSVWITKTFKQLCQLLSHDIFRPWPRQYLPIL